MRKYLVVATVLSLSLTSLAVAVPTYNSSWADVGGGLYGHTFWVDNPGAAASAWFVEMEWWGAPAAEIPAGTVPGTLINQVLAFGGIIVHEEANAIMYDPLDPSYDMTKDTWIMNEFGSAIMSTTEGANYYERQSGTAAGMKYVTVDHAYIVSDGSVKFAGRLGVDVGGTVSWTNVSGYSIVPEPATMLLLGVGALGLAIRKRR